VVWEGKAGKSGRGVEAGPDAKQEEGRVEIPDSGAAARRREVRQKRPRAGTSRAAGRGSGRRCNRV